MPSLLLHAAEPRWQPDDAVDLVGLLQDLGLAGAEKHSDTGETYGAGERFLSLVMFLGCSPRVLLDPQDAEPGEPVCHIRLLTFNEPTFLLAAKLPAVRCSNCRTPVEKFEPGSYDRLFSCSQCGKESELKDLDWRQAAGFGRCFIEISGIYPQEALPSDKLLDKLSDCSQSAWKYFYI